MSSPSTASSPSITAVAAPQATRGLHFEGTVLGFNLSTLVHSSSGSVTIKIRFETPQFTSEATGITWSKRSTLLSASVSAVASSDFGRRMRCNMKFSGEYSMCDDGIVTISVCKRRHRRSNWKTIASASLPLPNLLSAPFSGDLVLKKRDTDAASVTLAISASIVERFEQPGLLSRMHGKVKSSIARIFQGGERVGPADLGAASARTSADDGGSGYSSEVQGYTSDGRAAATLRRRGSQIGARDADGSTDDDLDVDDAMIHGIANVAKLEQEWSLGQAAQHSELHIPTAARQQDRPSFLDVSMNSDEGLDEVTAHGVSPSRLVAATSPPGDSSRLPLLPRAFKPHQPLIFQDASSTHPLEKAEIFSRGCVCRYSPMHAADEPPNPLHSFRFFFQGSALSPSWSMSLVDTLADHPALSSAASSSSSPHAAPWTITRAALASSSSPTAAASSSSSSGLWVKTCVSQLRSFAQPCLHSDLQPLHRLLELWSCDSGDRSPAPRILIIIGGDELFSSALRVISQSSLRTNITAYLIPLKQSTVADRIGSSCVRFRETFLSPLWLSALSKFGSGACDEEGHVLVSKIVTLLLDGVHSTQLQVATAVVGAEGGESTRAPIFHKAEVTCSSDIKLDYWTATGKKTKLRNVKYPVALKIATSANGSVSLVVSVSLRGSKRCDAVVRSVFDRLMTSKKTLASIDRGISVTKVLVRSSSLSDQLAIMTDGANVSQALFVNVTLGSDGDIECKVACFKPDAEEDVDSAGSLSSAGSFDDDI